MAHDIAFRHVLPIKGSNRDPAHYTYEVGDLMAVKDATVNDEASAFVSRCRGDVATLLLVRKDSGYCEYALAFSNGDDALLFKLTFGGK
jgi:hypothetical protein